MLFENRYIFNNIIIIKFHFFFVLEEMKQVFRKFPEILFNDHKKIKLINLTF
jgi:hypothetical protein